jgi:hypothetical protein
VTVNRRVLALACALALGPPAWADEVASSQVDAAVLVTGGGVGGVHHRVEAGQSLSFPTPGPATVSIEVRRRLPAVGPRPPAVRVTLLGDGAEVMALIAGQPAATGASIHDGRGGALSLPDKATLTVPAGGGRLTVRSPGGAPDLFVRVYVGPVGSTPSAESLPDLH